MTLLRVLIADDERPARKFLSDLLRRYDDVRLVGEAATGAEAVKMIESVKPDLALLDLQMPEIDGLSVVRLVRSDSLPLVAFVTAYDEYAVRAFALAAIDYLLKPVDPARLRLTLSRAIDRLESNDFRGDVFRRRVSAIQRDAGEDNEFLLRIPVRRKDDIIIVPVSYISSIVADGELLRLTTSSSETHTITYRLKDLEARLDPLQFIRLSRGTLANIAMVDRVNPMPGGTYLVTMMNGQKLSVSRLRGPFIRDQLLRL